MYYIYELVDPRDGKTFYIGKGKGNRIHHHEIEARKGIHSRKCQHIRAIWDAKLQVQRNVLTRFKSEHEAYAAEKQLIDEIGLENLTNVMPGGIWIPRSAPVKPRWGMHALLRLAPSIARAVREYAKHGNLYALGKYEISHILHELITGLVKDNGVDAVSREVGKYGVRLQFEGWDG